jgi:hypothetical protein
VKLIGNAASNQPGNITGSNIPGYQFAVANDSLYVLTRVSGFNTIGTLLISKDPEIRWQRKHVLTNNGWTIKGYAINANHAFVFAEDGPGDAFYLFIQSAVDGSTISAHTVESFGTGLGVNLDDGEVRGGTDSIFLSGRTLETAFGNCAFIGEISSAPSEINGFVIGKTAIGHPNITARVLLVNGADVYIGAVGSSVQTIIKTSPSGAIAWQKKVGSTSPPVIAANAASSRVYVGSGPTLSH